MNDIPALIERCAALYQTELKRHNDASHPINVLLFLVDNGLVGKGELAALNKRIIENGFTVYTNIPVAFGGTGNPTLTWIMCDLPITLYISIKLNNGKVTAKHASFIEQIAGRMEANGWRCSNMGNIGRFRGPGKKEEECPIATLNVLKLLTLTKEDEYVEQKRRAIQAITRLWEDRSERKAYLFGMGTDFRKLKYPMIWYDVVNTVDVLSHFPYAVQTKAFAEMFAILKKKIDDGDFIPQSVYLFWKGYDFGQKKTNSEYIERALRRIEGRIRAYGAHP